MNTTNTAARPQATTTTPRSGPWGQTTPQAAAWRGPRRLPHLLIGLLLVVSCVIGAVWWTAAADQRVPVLTLARPVPVGHVLSTADLRTVEISTAPGLATVAADQEASVLGRPMATSLPPGALLTPQAMGGAATPAPGHAVAAVGLEPGQFPPEISPGAPVIVVVTAEPTTTAATTTSAQQAQGSAWAATVVGRAPAGTDQTTVLSLQLETLAARELAQVPAGQVALVMQPVRGGGR